MRKDIPSAFCTYALPQMLGLLFNSVYFIVDGVFIGNRLGTDAMAAAGVAVPILEFLIAVSMAITAGCGVMVSISLAEDRRAEANRWSMHALLLALIIGILLAVSGSIFMQPLTTMLGSTPAIRQDVHAYLSIILSMSPFMILSFLLGGLVRNDGHPVHAMAALTIGSFSNIFLDWLFMYPCSMGISGAALATALGPLLSDIILLPHFLFRRGSLRFTSFRPQIRTFGRILLLGLPAFIMEFTIGMVTFITNTSIGILGMGETGLAAYLLIGYLMLIILTLYLGMAEGLQPVFSAMKGSHDTEGLRSLLRFSMAVFCLTGLICYLLVYFFSDRFYAMFTAGDTALLTFTAVHSRATFSASIFAGINILLISYWQATKKTARGMTAALLRSAILPPVFILLIPMFAGEDFFWYGHSVAETITAWIALHMLRRTR